MTDIVARLKSLEAHLDDWREVDDVDRETVAQARAEITRLRAKVAKADALAYRMDQVLADLTTHGGYTYEDDFPNELAALAAYREGSDT